MIIYCVQVFSTLNNQITHYSPIHLTGALTSKPGYVRPGDPADKLGTPANPSWQHFLRIYWPQYILLFILIILLCISETSTPYRHVLYSASDNELWKYSYPLRVNHVPAWAVPTIAVLAPCLSIAAAYLTGQITLFEAHQAAFAAITCVVTTGLMTNFIKVNVGRFRPNFVARCWPGGATPAFSADGRPQCLDNAVDPAEGMKSFPSGHTSWSTAGLGYLSFWLMGKLRCFNGGGRAGPLGLVLALTPLSGSIWIGASRLQDYWHHAEDVAVGFLLGLVMSYMFYRTAYAALMSPDAGCLVGGGQSGGGAGTAAGKSIIPIVNGDVNGGFNADDRV